MNKKELIISLTTVCFLLVCPDILFGFEQDRFQEREEMFESLAEACQESMETICSEETGRERVRCLMDNYDETSEDCRDVLDEIMSRRGARGEDTSP